MWNTSIALKFGAVCGAAELPRRLRNLRALRKPNIQILRPRNFTRTYHKTAYVKSAPSNIWCFCSEIYISRVICTVESVILIMRYRGMYGLSQWETTLQRYLSETGLEPKSREKSFTHNLFLSYPIFMKFCTELVNITGVLCLKYRKDWTTEMGVTDERDFARFEFWVLDRNPILHNVQYPKFLTWLQTFMRIYHLPLLDGKGR